MPGQLSVPQLFEAVTPFRRVAPVRAQEEVETIEGIFVGFAFTLDELVEFGIRFDMPELERHRGGDYVGSLSLNMSRAWVNFGKVHLAHGKTPSQSSEE